MPFRFPRPAVVSRPAPRRCRCRKGPDRRRCPRGPLVCPPDRRRGRRRLRRAVPGRRMTEPRRKVAVVMPAYNAKQTLERTYADVPKTHVDDIILVDDGSRDRTVEIARRLGIHVIVHPRNRGYGGNQKTCYRTALERGADVVIMVHPDHQYDPTVIPHLLSALADGRFDAAFGSRMLGGRPIQGGMPKWKYLGNILLT